MKKILWACELNTFGLINNYNNITVETKISVLFDTGTNTMILPVKILESIKQ